MTWLVYAVPAYVVWPVVFRRRYGHAAWVEPLVPRTAYQWTDFGLGLLLSGYTVWLAASWAAGGAAAVVRFDGRVAAGLGVCASGCGLRVWAVWALGPHWRIGQDDSDQKHEFVVRGPYRYYRHPINLALVIVAVGQGVLTGLDARAWALIGGAAVYAAIQNAREDRHWRGRAGAGSGGMGG